MKITVQPTDLEAGFGLVPSGIITMWRGSISTIPSGWVLCDGNNNTPDLRNQFIVCADTDNDGAAKATLDGVKFKSGGTLRPVATLDGPNGDGNDVVAAFQIQKEGGNYKPDTIYNGVNSTLPPFYALAFIMKI